MDGLGGRKENKKGNKKERRKERRKEEGKKKEKDGDGLDARRRSRGMINWQRQRKERSYQFRF